MVTIKYKDALDLDIYGRKTSVARSKIDQIENGRALLKDTKRWHNIICDCEENNDFDFQPAEPENNVPQAHKICNICNRVYYE